ncbi:MAG: hypothetical protein WDW36_005526 [Sanguina aurantia]
MCVCHDAPDFSRRLLIGGGVLSALVVAPDVVRAAAEAESADDAEGRNGKVRHSEEEWRKLLAPDSYRVLRQAATERSGTSALDQEKRVGTFTCGGCGSPLFNSSTKFNSGTGWPSFNQALPGDR